MEVLTHLSKQIMIYCLSSPLLTCELVVLEGSSVLQRAHTQNTHQMFRHENPYRSHAAVVVVVVAVRGADQIES